MHDITVTLTGVITDTVTVSLDDAAAFTKFMALKQQLAADSAPAKRRGRRAAALASAPDAADGTGSPSDPSDD